MAAFPVSAEDIAKNGAVFVTLFPGTLLQTAADGTVRAMLDPDGPSGLMLDLSKPGRPPSGQLLPAPPVLSSVTARQTGQVFGIAVDDAPSPNIYLTATAAFGLHRSADGTSWMPGMWGEGGGPGSVYRLSAADGYRPSLFAGITLNGRANSGAALGNIAYDRWHRQLYVSDLETGMIHRLGIADGVDLGHWDHGVAARPGFLDASTGQRRSLEPVAFDPASAARLNDCPSGNVAADPACWNIADFRRRVWGLGVARDEASGDVRLFYAIWGSEGFRNPDHDSAGDDARNAVWSVRIAADGDFDAASARREFILPDFFHRPDDIVRAGPSQPVSDIAFAARGDQNVMLLAERGGLRNRGLRREEAFAWPGEARVLRYVRDDKGVWQPDGRHDIGYDDRRKQGLPYLRAGASGGVTFAAGYDPAGTIDPSAPDAFIWATGDNLCTPAHPCVDGGAGAADVSGLQGFAPATKVAVEPEAALAPHPRTGPAYAPTGPQASYFVAIAAQADPAAPARNDATRIGDVEAIATMPFMAERPDQGPWFGPWEGTWPWPLPGPGFEPVAGTNAPELVVTKAAPPVCDWGGLCSFALTISNSGPGPYSGPVHVVDTPDHFGTLPHASPGWTCIQPAMPGPVACRHDAVVLAAGESLSLVLSLHMPLPAGPLPPWPTTRNNCGFFAWPAALSGDARNRAIEAALALAGYDTGPVDGILDPVAMAAINLYRLDHGLPPGGPDDALLAVLFPDSAGLPGDAVPGNDFACAPFVLPGTDPLPHPPPPAGPDLALEKTLASPACMAGELCDFRIRVRNAGGAPYHGLVAFTDTAGVSDVGPLPAAAIHAASPLLACVPDPGGGRRCGPGDGAAIDLAPGAFVDYTIRLNVPVAATGHMLENCGFLRWADTATPGGDGNPGNDFMCASTLVPIVAPAIGPELSLTKTAGLCGFENPGHHFCQYEFAITNNGGQPFEGVIAVADEVPPQARMSAWGGPAEVRWECAQPGGPGTAARCLSEGEVRLAPGESTTLDVRLVVPAAIAAAGYVNCGTIAWDAMTFPGGRDANPDNERGCADVPAASASAPESEPATESGDIDLGVVKTGPEGGCTPGQECTFTVTVTNNGPGAYDGPLYLSEVRPFRPGELPASEHPTLVGTAPAEWRCVPMAGAASGLNCLRPATVLGPAESLSFEVTWLLPPINSALPLSNCAWVRWPAALDDSEANIIANAQWALALRGYFDGTVDAVMSDELREAIRAYQADNGLAVTGEIDAALRGSLYAGTAALRGDANPDNDRACAETPLSGPTGGAALSVVKTGPASGVCARGEHCLFNVRVTNAGPDNYNGPLMLQDLVPEGVVITASSFFGSGTTGEYRADGRSSFTVTDSISFMPGMSREFGINIYVPDDYAPGTMRNCAYALYPVERINNASWIFLAEIQLSLLGYDTGAFDASLDAESQAGLRAFQRDNGLPETGNLDPDTLAALFPRSLGDPAGRTAEGCVEVEVRGVLSESDLAPGGGTQCVRGTECRLDVTINNRGNAQFEGAAGLRGVLDPAVAISRIEARSPGLACRVTGVGTYECSGSALSIKPGDAAHIDVIATIPAEFPADSITHTKDMLWPDAAGKDRHPENDRHVSTITIVDPPALPVADLALAKTADKATCIAGERCGFTVTVSNRGAAPFSGEIILTDLTGRADVRLAAQQPSTWSCKGGDGTYRCASGAVTLAPGQSSELTLSFAATAGAAGAFENCVSFDRGGATSILAVQQALNAAGYAAGTPDGVVGSRTRAAIRAYQRDHGLVVTGVVDEALLASLLGGANTLDADATNDRACATVTLVAAPPAEETTGPAQPEADRATCPEGWKYVPAEEARKLAARGWLSSRVQRGSVTLYCVRPGAPLPGPECRSGWSEVSRDRAKDLAGNGWQIVQETRNGQSILCARQLPRPVCPSGWSEVSRTQAKALAGRGYDIREIARNNIRILCARKRPEVTTAPVCPRGWTRVAPDKAAALLRQGWKIITVRQGNSLIRCARRG